jgi:hypothetical protein
MKDSIKKDLRIDVDVIIVLLALVAIVFRLPQFSHIFTFDLIDNIQDVIIVSWASVILYTKWKSNKDKK